MKHVSLRAVLGGLCTGALIVSGLVAVATPFAHAQQVDSTGRTMTDFARTLTLDGFDSSVGQLVAADVTLSASLDSRLLEITNNSGGAADFTVTTTVEFCGALGQAPASYGACAAGSDPTTLRFATQVLAESFVNLGAGQTAASAQPATASDIASLRVLDQAALAQFIDVASVDIGVGTLAGFEALGGGGNSLVEIETFADVAAQVNYIYAGVRIDKLTNGADGVAVQAGDAVEWTYDVTNTGNTALQNAEVTDDQEGAICTIPLIEAGETQRCTAGGTAGAVDYQNIARVVARPIVNPSIPVADDDPSSYVIVAPTPIPATPVPTSPPSVATPTPTAVPTPGSTGPGTGPAIDIELATNGIDADVAPGVSLDVGQPITWTYVVTNTGVVDLYDVVVTDDLAGGVCRAVSIPVAGQTSCTLEGVAVEGTFRRVGDVLGESITGQRVADVDPTHHVVTDEVLGLVVTPVPVDPNVPASPPLSVPAPATPDEVLAYTGGQSDERGLIGGALVVSGFGALALSTGVRRRRSRDGGGQ